MSETGDKSLMSEIRALKSLIAFQDLKKDIAKLEGTEITDKTAPLIGGLYLARDIESGYLLAFMSDDELPDDQLRESAGKLHLVFAEANKGSYGLLKNYLREKSKEWEERSGMDLGNNFNLMAERIPLQGPPIEAPAPAWKEEPIPLREQLRQLQQGGGKS